MCVSRRVNKCHMIQLLSCIIRPAYKNWKKSSSCVAYEIHITTWASLFANHAINIYWFALVHQNNACAITDFKTVNKNLKHCLINQQIDAIDVCKLFIAYLRHYHTCCGQVILGVHFITCENCDLPYLQCEFDICGDYIPSVFVWHQGPPLLTSIYVNPSMDK